MATIGFVTLLTFKIGTLLNGSNAFEVASKAQAMSLRDIVYNPAFLPYKIVQHTLIYIHHDSLVNMRLISASFGLLAIILFYFLLQSWHTKRIAMMGTALFVSSAWFLHSARDATPVITLTGVLLILAYSIYLKTTTKPTLAIILGAAALIYLIYIPGLIWFLVAGIVWQRKLLATIVKRANLLFVILSLLLIILGMVPLFWGGLHNLESVKAIVGLPLHGLPPVIQYLKNILSIPKQLYVQGPHDPTYWAGNVPLLDIFVSFMSFIGIYAYYHKRRLDRSKFLAGYAALAVALIALGGFVNIILLLPVVYIVAVAGLTLLLQQWFTVFPRNPFARTVGTTLITVVVLMACFYNVTAYFIAWPNTPETKQIYRTQQTH